MEGPENGIHIVMGEINLLVTAMKRNSRWTNQVYQVSVVFKTRKIIFPNDVYFNLRKKTDIHSSAVFCC